MDILDRLKSAIEKLLEQNRQLKSKNDFLQTEKKTWQKERSYLVGEIDRILERIDAVQLEES